ncbi:hypothetical protein G5C51_27530 [Streptomyces sp. A7024]|uniref:YCII-related domain-containing protein n=1 Tax=Streptomyces coryli TaxID=1128680 RepID=A0A6G4U7D2_9ACTN|nr:YciI family protein [Streptomyces coryli]NGN67640.1 hypothetical protein [Streptomyces coryli]
MAKYLVLIYGDEQRWANMSPAESAQIDEGHRAFAAKAGAAILGSGQLQASGTAVTVGGAGSGDRPLISDGPFMETKEVIGGFYILETADLDEATALASTLTEASHDHSAVEVRPLVDHG